MTDWLLLQFLSVLLDQIKKLMKAHVASRPQLAHVWSAVSVNRKCFITLLQPSVEFPIETVVNSHSRLLLLVHLLACTSPGSLLTLLSLFTTGLATWAPV